MQRLLAPLAAATAVIAVVAVSAALVSGGSTRKGSTAHRERPETGITTNRTAADAAMIRAGVIGLFLPATGTQYTTGSLFHGQIDALESDATATCMARSGFQSRPITAANAVAAYGYYDLSQFPDLGLISRTGELSRNYFYNPGPAHWSKAYTRANKRCGNAAMRPFAHLLQVGFPLGSPFPDTSKTPAAVAAKVPALRSCAARYGWPGTPVINSFADFVSWVAGHLDGPVSKGSAAEVLALNHHWAPIFVKCAGPTVTVQYRLWTAQQKIFLARHRAQVQALVALAIRVMTIAERQAGTTAG